MNRKIQRPFRQTKTDKKLLNRWNFIPRLQGLESRDVPSAFTPGDIVVYRVGDGSAALAGTGAAVFLDEYTTAGTLVQSINVGTEGAANGGAANFVATGNATTEGTLSLSADGTHLILTGYNTTVGGSTEVAGTNRVIGTVDAGGIVNTAVQLTGASQGTTDLRGAASVSGNGTDAYYITTSTTVSYVATPGPAATSTSLVGLNSRAVAVVGSGSYETLYASTASTGTAAKLSAFGTLGTLPTAATTAVTPPIVSLAVANGVNGFFFCNVNASDPFSGPDTVYAIDSIGNLLYKYTTTDGINWTSDGSIAVPSPATGDGVTGVASGGNVSLYVSNAAHAFSLTDASGFGGALSGSLTQIASAATNEGFRGIAMVPTAAQGTAPVTVGLGSSGTPALYGSPVTFTATVTAVSGTTAPTRNVAFQYNGATLAVMPLTATTATASQATFTTSSLPIGTDAITAVYTGDSTYASMSSTPFNQVINGTTTNTGLTSDTSLPTIGQSVTFTATVTANSGGVAPGGTVNFFDNGFALNTSPINLVPGAGLASTATVTVSTNAIQAAQMLTPGSHTITAVYTPPAGFTGGTATMIQNVKPNPFGAGDLLVYRVGDGTNTLLPSGNTVYIDEYTTDAGQSTPVQSIVMPTSAASALGAGGNQALITDSQQSTEGQLSLSGNGEYVFLDGYDTSPGGSATLTTTSGTAVPRTIGRIGADGSIDTSVALTDLASAGSVRGVYSPDGNQVYATGSTGGVRYIPSLTPATTTSTLIDGGATALNQILVAGGQLYVSAGSTATATTNTVKIASVGAGSPTTSGNTLTTLSGIPTGDSTPIFPQGFYFTSLMTGPEVGPDTLYIADSGTNFLNGSISKWTLANGTWSLTGTVMATGVATNPSFDDITGVNNGDGTVNLYATYGNGGTFTGPGYLYGMTDIGGYGGGLSLSAPVTTLASVGNLSNETFRGVSVVPTQPTTVAGITVSDGVAADGTTQRSEVRQIVVNFSTPVTFAGGNSNAAAAFQLSQINETNSHFTTPVAVNNLIAAVSPNGMSVTLTFSTTGNTNANDTGTIDSESALNGASPSLNNGRFSLTISSADVTASNGTALNGGVDYVSPTDTQGGGPGQVGLYRDFGDALGTGVVDQTNLGQFRSAFNNSAPSSAYVNYLDANNDGHIDQVDLGFFRQQFNSSVFN